MCWIAIASVTATVINFTQEGPGLMAFAAVLAGALLLMPLAMRLACRMGCIGLPGGRSIHSAAIPLAGGVAMFPAIAVALAVFAPPGWMGLAAGGAVVAVGGLVDDVRGLSPRTKIATQALAALALYWAGIRPCGLIVATFSTPAAGALSLLVLCAWVVLVTNALNIIDGLDGLAGSVGLVACAGALLLGWGGVLPAMIAGGLIAFLRSNLPPAKAFLGDGGTMLVGFLLAAAMIDPQEGVNVPVALGILALPAGDAALAVVRRWLRGRPLFVGDRGHVHHLLLRRWRSPGRVLAILAAFSLLAALLSVAMPDMWGLAAVGVLWAGLLAHLVCGAWPRIRSLLLHRRRFRRMHLIREFAGAALPLADTRPEVEAILGRVVADLNLGCLRVGDLVVRRPEVCDAHLPLESIACRDSEAAWSAPPSPDEVYDEERRAAVCELARCASDLLARFPREDGAKRGDDVSARWPAAHFILADMEDAESLAPTIHALRTAGGIKATLVNTSTRDHYEEAVRSPSPGSVPEPDVDLDIDSCGGPDPTATLMARYASLLEVCPPSVVVIASTTDIALSCALVAMRQGLAVVRVGRASGSERLDPARTVRKIRAAVPSVPPAAIVQSSPDSARPLWLDVAAVVAAPPGDLS